MDRIEQLRVINFSIDSTDDGANRLAMLPRNLCYTSRRFAFQCLPVEFAFAGHNNVRLNHFLFEFEDFGNELKARTQLCATEAHQSKTETASGPRAGRIPKFATKLAGNNIGQSRERLLENDDLFRCRALLWAKYTSCAAFA